jgi:CubicO group peptidase (beta-lactamase class C family)
MSTAPEHLPTAAALCKEAVASGRVLGVYLYVRHRGELLADVAYGEAEPGVTAGTDDVGELRCAVKPLTTLCVALAMEAGLLRLDDTLARWAPAGASPRIAALSLRQLLTHSSGLPNYPLSNLYEVGFAEYVAGVLSSEYPSGLWDAQPIYSLARGWHLLAWVLQEVHGRPIHELVAESVTGPLGLSSMSLLDPSAVSRPLQRRAAEGGYTAIRDADAATVTTRPNPAYGGFSTTRDLGRLFEHLMRCRADGGLVSRDTMRALLRRQGDIRFRPGGAPLPFGLGFFLGGSAAGFGAEWAADSFGHMGSIREYYGTVVLCSPSDQTVVAIRFSSIGRANNPLLAALGRAVHGDLALPDASTSIRSARASGR